MSKSIKLKIKEGKWTNPALSENARKKILLSVSGTRNGMYRKTHSKETLKKMSLKKKGVPKSEAFKLKRRERRQKELELTYGKSFYSFNIKACNYCDKLSKENNWNLQRALNGGEFKTCGYWVDGYDKEKNIVVEYDEPYHFRGGKLKEECSIRMKRIVDHLKCSFYRYNEKLNELVQYY